MAAPKAWLRFGMDPETGAEPPTDHPAGLREPPEPYNERHDHQERQSRDGGHQVHRRPSCRGAGSKISGRRVIPARTSRSVNLGRTRVAWWKPSTRPSSSIPACSYTKMSCEEMTDSSMPLTSVTRTIFRLPSLKRAMRSEEHTSELQSQ